MLAALLEHGRLVCLDEKKLEVGFASDSIFLESARDRDKVGQLKTMSEAFFGRTLRVVIAALEKDTAPRAPEPEPDVEIAGARVEEQAPQNNTILDEALSLFDATIVEVKAAEEGSREVGGGRKERGRK
jgi:hypothetical protein